MAKGTWGGARAGAGRKKAETKVAQATRRDILLEVFTEEETREVAIAMRERIKRDGDPKAFGSVAPFIFGKPPEEIDLNVNGQIAIRSISAIKPALTEDERGSSDGSE